MDELLEDWKNDLFDPEFDLDSTFEKYLLPGSVKNTDYNLNNPLLFDEIHAFHSFYFGKEVSSLFIKPTWKTIKQDIIYWKLKIDSNNTGHHAYSARYMKDRRNQEDFPKALWTATLRDAKITHAVPEAFMKSLGVQDYHFLEEDLSDTSLSYFDKFLRLHLVTLCLNHFNDNLSIFENSELITKYSIQNRPSYFKVNINKQNYLLVFPGLVLTDSGLILSKNFALMIKDMALARFQTLMTMWPRIDKRFSLYDVSILEKLYDLGDDLLIRTGSDGYDMIKMVEPICNLRLCQLAKRYRPLIPDFPSFRVHVQEEVNKLAEKEALCNEIYKLIINLENHAIVIQIFGTYRHWGHPFIDYFLGLEKLHEQVSAPKVIDDGLAQCLGSDLALLILKKQFQEKKKWYVDQEKLPKKHIFKSHIKNGTWPTPKQIEDFGNNWHNLPLLPCFEIPDMIDPANIYSDKSHSIQKNELRSHIQRRSHEPIPTKKVLNSFLEKPARDWPKFLKEINDHGLSDDSLCIGLRCKERELKKQGRFFALMSWELREYFVVTEYLIKEHFVKLFSGLTMADDMTGVIKKLIETSNGHGEMKYDHITLSNHLDYSKWNNNQRYESNRYVFRVMGEFLGYPHLIERTHEFFKKSLIYFVNRPDLMIVDKDLVKNKGEERVCWNGQDGGLEGLRQKGWSIVNLLLIMRIGKLRNTEIKILAQGDNQVLNTHYQVPSYRSEEELKICLQEIGQNNNAIMEEVKRSTGKLGLIINEDETMQSADFLIYGKVPIFRGNILLPESKRWSRVNCVTNDQLPTFGNILSTVSSTALTVSHFSTSFADPIQLYNKLGNLSRLLLELYDPILNQSLTDVVPNHQDLGSFEYLVSSLYLDPSLGGISGLNLNRFLIRNFPDPITEGLAFWKNLYLNTQNNKLKRLSLIVGNPSLATFKISDLTKLIEKPESLNIPTSYSAQTMIRTEIREILKRNVKDIKNEIIQDAILYGIKQEEHLLRFLWSIKPLFPRFMSEFKSSTYLGLSESLVGLYENSRTIRTRFLRNREKNIDLLIQKSEIKGLLVLTGIKDKAPLLDLWDCSSSLADQLRYRSWGSVVIGATIPHPSEMFRRISQPTSKDPCCQITKTNDYLTVFFHNDKDELETKKGPYLPYLGSRTRESTSILNPWDKTTIVPLIKRATKLRDSINWFIAPDSNLAQSIFNNIESLTGEDCSLGTPNFSRTGSAIHRYSSSRQSSGGYSSLSPAILSRVLTTTDTLGDLGDTNYDFMFQSSILYSQSTTVCQLNLHDHETYHFHLTCHMCLRGIEEPLLESSHIYAPVSVKDKLKKWIPSGESIFTKKETVVLNRGNWNMVTATEKSYHIGRAIGFVFGDGYYLGKDMVDDTALFPISIRRHLIPEDFYKGLISGLVRSSSIHIVHRRSLALMRKPRATLTGSVFFLIRQLSHQGQFLTLIREGPLHDFLMTKAHRTPPSYPLAKHDLGEVVRHHLKLEFVYVLDSDRFLNEDSSLWVFADLSAVEVAGPYILSTTIMENVVKPVKSKENDARLRELKDLEISLRSGLPGSLDMLSITNVALCLSEVRHAAKDIPTPSSELYDVKMAFGSECVGEVYGRQLRFGADFKDSLRKPEVIRKTTPLISGLRTIQIATGSHYKIRSIIKEFDLKYRDFISGGDGSGGITSYLLRENPFSRGVFNSLLNLTGYDLRGSKPSPPSAVVALGLDKTRCLNYQTCWEEPSDLVDQETWEYFAHLKRDHRLKVDLICLDMEVQEPSQHKIEKNLEKFHHKLLEPKGNLIIKTYAARLLDEEQQRILYNIGKHYDGVYLLQTEFTSSFSSEVYILYHELLERSIFPLELNKEDLYLCAENVFSQGTHLSELSRAAGLKKYNLIQGVPLELIPNLNVELQTLLEVTGVETGLCSTIAEIVLKYLKNDTDLWKFLVISISNSVLNISASYESEPSIPSTNKLQKWLTFVVGLTYWRSWIDECESLFKLADLMTNEDILFSHRNYTDQHGCRRSYAIGQDKGGTIKNIRIRGKGAGIGSTIRILSRVTKKPNNSSNQLKSLLSLVNKGLTVKLVNKVTNLMTFENKYVSGDGLFPSTEITNLSKLKSSSWDN